MTTTVGQPERSQWATDDWSDPVRNPWAQEAIAQRGYDDFDTTAAYSPEDAERDILAHRSARLAGDNRAKRTPAAVLSAIADATGQNVADLDENIGLDDAMAVIDHDLADPQAALAALDRALAYPEQDHSKAAPGESDGTYKAREGNWRERHNMPRRRKSVPPSRTPEARRARTVAAAAERLGISPAEAERLTQRRPRKAHDPKPVSSVMDGLYPDR
jgi:hypothetical protein